MYIHNTCSWVLVTEAVYIVHSKSVMLKATWSVLECFNGVAVVVGHLLAGDVL